MTKLHTLGFPRIGAERELKFALERYWRGEIQSSDLEQQGQNIRKAHWQLQQDAGLDWVTLGDFAFYDQVANHIQWFGCEPARFGFTQEHSPLTRHFALARGHNQAEGSAGRALEMTKWFDTNYHYLVPEFTPDSPLRLQAEPLLQQVAEAQALGHALKVALIGPLTFLWLGKEKTQGWSRLSLLEPLLAQYRLLLAQLKALGVGWVQLDEPILGLDLPDAWRQAFEPSYNNLTSSGPPLLLATYFSALKENLGLSCRLPVQGLHIDALRAPEEVTRVADWLPQHKVLSIGIVDGRNLWRSDLDAALKRLRPIQESRQDQLWLAPSCSLLHLPLSLAKETRMDPDIKSWLAFGLEKLSELRTLRWALEQDPRADAPLALQRQILTQRSQSPHCTNPELRKRLAQINQGPAQRETPVAQRLALQQQHLNLPLLPTTTIGSFPQTAEIRAARAAYKHGHLSQAAYESSLKKAIAQAITAQEDLDIDVLVHGEAERNDMVEYFGEQLNGIGFSDHGWVQSYGSRCVKPPIIYGDITRPAPITLDWTCYAQRLTTRPIKGMLTGPMTLLQWSFVRDDQPRNQTAQQLALAIRDEVSDLEAAGIQIIQIDEPAIREGLPLRLEQQSAYWQDATYAFRLCSTQVADTTQIHTHMCYCEFNDAIDALAQLDADVISLETSRSDMELLDAFKTAHYPGDVGPGVYDIHSPSVPQSDEIARLLSKALAVIPANRLWVNPDCGLKTRTWPEVLASLSSMVIATKHLRRQLASAPQPGPEVAESP
jgi:5-methyltetrahydropteroyltriglutamate--homocysteine methyltransferase